jgi:hypothetical protein
MHVLGQNCLISGRVHWRVGEVLDKQEDLRKLLRHALAEMPVTIEFALSRPDASATGTLHWVRAAMRLVHDPVGRPASHIDIKNKRKAAEILKGAVPTLQRIRDDHQSERLRKKADQYIRYIASL